MRRTSHMTFGRAILEGAFGASAKGLLLTTVLVAFLLRAMFLFAPIESSWRECQTGMQTRNLSRDGWDFLHPKMDWGGPKPVTVVMELPVFNVLWAAADEILGGTHHLMTGRLLSLVFGLVSLVLVYRIGTLLDSPILGLLASAFYAASPLTWHLEAAAMPEALWQAITLAALYAAIVAAREDRNSIALVSIAFLSLSLAIKLPQGGLMAVGIGTVWLYERYRLSRPIDHIRIAQWLIPIVLAGLWYFHMHLTNLESHSPWDFGQQSSFLLGTWSERISPSTTLRFLVRFFVYGGPLLAFGALMGLVQLNHRPLDRPGYVAAMIVLAVSILFQYVVVHGSFVAKHYQYIASAPLCLVAAFGAKSITTRIRSGYVVGAILLFQIVWSGGIAVKLWRDYQNSLVVQAATQLRDNTKPNEAIVVEFVDSLQEESSNLAFVTSPTAPFIFYIADRRGITILRNTKADNEIDRFVRQGFSWILRIDLKMATSDTEVHSFSLIRIKDEGS